MAKLFITEGNNTGMEVDVPPKGVVIGRREECDLTISDDLASGRHAKVEQQDGQWVIVDLGSTNGTLIDNQRISAVSLADGDSFKIGNTKIVFKLNGSAAAEAAPPWPAIAPGDGGSVAAASGQATAEPEAAPESAPASKPSSLKVKARPKTPAAATAGAEGSLQASPDDLKLVEQMSRNADAIRRETAKLIIGQREVLDQILMCMIAGGHALLVGMPGLAKTTIVSTIAKVLDLEFKRVQFTPDLMPADITGTEILETNKSTNEKEFRFIKGPIFCNLLLADEINRTPPKTQASLLEAMQEKRVTVGNTTYTLDPPFFVLATQNPLEQEGTYPLPEAQMDRFMFNIWVDYPQEDEEEKIIAATTVKQLAQPEKVLDKQQVLQLQSVVRKIPVSDHIIKYTIRLVRSTRPGGDKTLPFVKEFISTGAGPRAGQYLILAAKARAVLEGRIHISCADIRSAAIPVLRHRIYTNFAADSEGMTSMHLIRKLLEAVPEPGEDDYKK